MRLSLSLYVILLHTPVASYGTGGDAIFWNTPLRPFYQLAMPMFFALSGFLVAGSLERSKTIGLFLGLRIIRIYPALAVEVMLSAFILGPILTTVTLGDYFSQKSFWVYLLNVTGDIHFHLPGLFVHNPMPGLVNGQLWTIPFELLCYISITVLATFGIIRHRLIGPAAVVIATIGLIAARLVKYHGHFPALDSNFPGSLLVISFLSGMTLFLYRDAVRWDVKIFWVMAAASLALLGVIPNGAFFSPVPVAYVTVYLGLTNFRRIELLRHADLSYGIFLYGFVIQQSVADIFPWSHHWYLNFLISAPLSALVASISWHFIERPALGLRKNLAALEKRYLAAKQARLLFPPFNA